MFGNGVMEYGHPRVKRVTESEIVQYLCGIVGGMPGDIQTIHLHEMAWDVKHACKHLGVSEYHMQKLPLRDGSNVFYAYCPACRRLWYYVERY